MFLRGLLYLAVTFVITCIFSVARDARSSGFVSPTAEGIPFACALLWIFGVFVCELVRTMRTVTSGAGIGVKLIEALIGSVVWPIICAITIVGSWIFAVMVLPSASAVYFKLNKSDIQSHWQSDAVSQLTYFPIAFANASPIGKLAVPSRYYVSDEHHDISFDFVVHRFKMRGCSDDNTTVLRVEEQIYFVFQYSEPGTLHVTPCLISPTPKNAG
jgi:hypothetical protein